MPKGRHTSKRPGDRNRPQVAAAVNDIRALVAALARSARAVEQETGLSNAQLLLVRELKASPDLTINELAARAMTRQSTVSILVRRLEDAGLVRRERAEADARRVHVHLTAKGEALAVNAPKPPTARLISALHTMSPTELTVLCRSLEKLLQGMHASTASPPPLFEPSRRVRTRS